MSVILDRDASFPFAHFHLAHFQLLISSCSFSISRSTVFKFQHSLRPDGILRHRSFPAPALTPSNTLLDMPCCCCIIDPNSIICLPSTLGRHALTYENRSIITLDTAFCTAIIFFFRLHGGIFAKLFVRILPLIPTIVATLR